MKLLIEDDQGKKMVVPFASDEITVGRQSPGNVVCLPERNVSRRHARFLTVNGSIFIEDLSSRNGTRVNGERIEGRRKIRTGDLVQIGDFDLALHEGAEQVQQPAEASPTLTPVAPYRPPSPAPAVTPNPPVHHAPPPPAPEQAHSPPHPASPAQPKAEPEPSRARPSTPSVPAAPSAHEPSRDAGPAPRPTRPHQVVESPDEDDLDSDLPPPRATGRGIFIAAAFGLFLASALLGFAVGHTRLSSHAESGESTKTESAPSLRK